jgi:hypothetical protein
MGQLRCSNGKLLELGKLLDQPKNVTSFSEDSEGELYMVIYDGHIYRVIVPDRK